MRYFPCFLLLFVHSLTAQVPPVFDSLQPYFSSTLFFDSDIAKLDEEALQVLQECPAPQGSTERLYLTGHTDAIGSDSYNEDLARRRAMSAQEILKQKGWTDSMMVIQTFGERTPVATNNVEAGRRKNRRVTLDFYQAIPYRILQGRVIDGEGGQPLPEAFVRIHGKTISDTLQLDSLGRFSIALPIDTVVGVEIYSKGYFLDSKMLKMRPKTIAELKIELTPAKPGAVADIEELFFVGNQAILLPRSEDVPPKILRFMQINPHLQVEIAGHVNYPNLPPVKEDTFEWDLSVRRAKLIYDYLINHGVPAEQLKYRGYGNHEMRFPNARTAQDQEANRRVEIRVLGTMPN